MRSNGSSAGRSKCECLRGNFQRKPLDQGESVVPHTDRGQPAAREPVKRRLFGSTEESISISQVASVKILTGVIWSDIVIESSGGTDPITSHGHRKGDALRIRDLVEGFQAARR